jgi:hypothetical protein
MLVQCAHAAVKGNNPLAYKYKRLEKRIGRNKAIVCIARKMLCYTYVMLTKGKEFTQIESLNQGSKVLEHARVCHAPLS